MSEPLTDEQLRIMRIAATHEVDILIDEIERLRAAFEALSQAYQTSIEFHEAQIDAIRPMMEKLAAAEPYYSEQPEGWHCMLCDGWYPERWTHYPDGGKSQLQHDADCPVTLARIWLTEYPKTEQ
jgi:hypothetical protein